MNSNGKQRRKQSGLNRFELRKKEHSHKRKGKVFRKAAKKEKEKHVS